MRKLSLHYDLPTCGLEEDLVIEPQPQLGHPGEVDSHLDHAHYFRSAGEGVLLTVFIF